MKLDKLHGRRILTKPVSHQEDAGFQADTKLCCWTPEIKKPRRAAKQKTDKLLQPICHHLIFSSRHPYYQIPTVPYIGTLGWSILWAPAPWLLMPVKPTNVCRVTTHRAMYNKITLHFDPSKIRPTCFIWPPQSLCFNRVSRLCWMYKPQASLLSRIESPLLWIMGQEVSND